MDVARGTDARIVKTNNVLLVLSPLKDKHWVADFCGAVVTARDLADQRPQLAGKSVYLCGDLAEARGIASELSAADSVRVIAQHTDGSHEAPTWPSIPIGRVPMLVHGVGVLYRRFFDLDGDYFDRIRSEHAFQCLTESNKPSRSHRTGIYLTPVERVGQDLHFRLLRCSTNLSGPTENFRATDRHIVDALNQEADRIFADHARLNHVLAQIYPNTAATNAQRQTKAKISAHADKTKDMPGNAIMAFCTFYDRLPARGPDDESALTRLIFRRKAGVTAPPGYTLPERFEVTLDPNSVFFLPLSTNRWYTHEVRPSRLDAALLPTRLGYVVRCSATPAVHKDGQTFLMTHGRTTILQPPSPEGMVELRDRYAQENRTDARIDYADRFPFSMNEGDYLAPDYRASDEFRQYALAFVENPFEALLAAVRFQDVSRGRQGAVLVRPDDARGTPIVRTTTRYCAAAQCFGPVHVRLAEQIRRAASLPVGFNNALVERYTNAYTTMGSHSDQAQDLAEASSIALFSCYRDPQVNPPRSLVVASKAPGGGTFEIPLVHNSVVVFSVDTNRRFEHKIVLDRSTNPPDNEWLGFTLRTSRTFVRFDGAQAQLDDGVPLTLADDAQAQQLFQLRGRENREPGFVYPPMSFTISASDLMPPEP